MTSQNNHFATRDRLIIDRLWQMKKAAIDIMNSCAVEIAPDGLGDCKDDKCSSCAIRNINCGDIIVIADMDIPECCQEQASWMRW